jgi:hypothetical protein
MIPFMFECIIGLLVIGLFFYLVRWAVGYFSLPQPVMVVITVLFIILFLYWAYANFPAGGFPRVR